MNMRARANPTKAFFVNMLTRDISLVDCILDLIDNSIDSAWAGSGSSPVSLEADGALSEYRIDLVTSGEEFSISDNCGGIDLDDAINYAFTFGHVEDAAEKAYSVGVYGIGMKRAVFKMGNAVSVISTFHDGSTLDAFEVPIDVAEWLRDTGSDWDFSIEQATPFDAPGVRITVRELASATEATFADPTFARRLRGILARDYMVPLTRGLQITLNGEQVLPQTVSFATNSDIQPYHTNYTDGDVSVTVIAGMTSAPPDDASPDGSVEDMSGWWVVCNGRVILAADRSELTVWGLSGVPRWHRQYAGFTGFVFFNSDNPLSLPMTTTKRSVNESSRLYQRSRTRMADPTKSWVAYTNQRKPDLEVARAKERATGTLGFAAVPTRSSIGLPQLPKPVKARDVATVNYIVDLVRMRRLASAFGDVGMTYRDVGLKSFEFAYDATVDEE